MKNLIRLNNTDFSVTIMGIKTDFNSRNYNLFCVVLSSISAFVCHGITVQIILCRCEFEKTQKPNHIS